MTAHLIRALVPGCVFVFFVCVSDNVFCLSLHRGETCPNLTKHTSTGVCHAVFFVCVTSITWILKLLFSCSGFHLYIVTFHRLLLGIVTVISSRGGKKSQGKGCRILKDYFDILAHLHSRNKYFTLSVLNIAEKTDSTRFDLGNSLGGII